METESLGPKSFIAEVQAGAGFCAGALVEANAFPSTCKLISGYCDHYCSFFLIRAGKSLAFKTRRMSGDKPVCFSHLLCAD